MSFIMPYTDNGDTLHPDSFWVLHTLDINRIGRHAMLVFHGWPEWQDYPDQTKIIGEHVYTITNPDDYIEWVGLGDESSRTPYFVNLEGAATNLDEFFSGATHYADSLPVLLVIDRPTGIVPELHGPNAVLIQFPDVVDLPGNSQARGLVASWKLDEVTGATRVDALGRTTNNLTSHNGVARNASGRVGACASFTAASSMYLSASSNADLQIIKVGEHIIACWVKRASDSSIQCVASKGSVEGGFSITLVTAASGNGIHFAASNNELDTIASIAADGQWHFIVASIVLSNSGFGPDPAILRVSVDGGAFEIGSGGGVPEIESENANFYIGKDIDSLFPFDGLIDAFDKYYFPTPFGDSDRAALATALYNGSSGWEPSSGDDWRAGVTLLVNGSPVALATATSNIGSPVVWYKVAASFEADDVVTWEYDATAGLIQNTPAGLPVGPVSETSVDNQVGEYLDFSDPANSGHLLQLLG